MNRSIKVYNTTRKCGLILCCIVSIINWSFKTFCSWLLAFCSFRVESCSISSMYKSSSSVMFVGPLFWTFNLNSFYRFWSWFISGNWLGHSRMFIFFFLHHSFVSLAEYACDRCLVGRSTQVSVSMESWRNFGWSNTLFTCMLLFICGQNFVTVCGV